MPLAPLPSLPSRGRARTPRVCACGCSLMTRGGSFVVGHDSRRLGWAVRLWRGGDVTGITPGERAAAIAWIRSGVAARVHPASFVGVAAPGVLVDVDSVADVA